ncbi:hypothetical protein ACIA58_19070 [Kribbella sp. NPDC051586]|uniref:hypothetical protein n=1 Tax=Kribbella sp. NPDC051586 TaxID=3364118 RepID=UPI00378B9400
MTTPDDRRYDTELDDTTRDGMGRADAARDDNALDDSALDDRMADDRMADDRMADDRVTGDRMADDRSASRTEDAMTATPTGDEPLVAEDSAVDYRARWEVIQQGFVDDPRKAVTEADSLVDDVLKALSDTFDRQHQGLEQQWSGGEPSTEDLRSALQRYRAFFQRLLTL